MVLRFICEIAFQYIKVGLNGTSFQQYHKSDESFSDNVLATSHFMHRWVDMRNDFPTQMMRRKYPLFVL